MSVPQFTPCYCFAGSTTGSDGYRYCFNDWWGSETHICTRGESNATSTPKVVMKADSLQALHSGKGGRSTKAKLPGASLHSRAMQGSALRVGPVDILQTDVRPLPQLILSENKTTLLAEHRDLIIRVPGLNSFLSVCNVTSWGKGAPTQDMAIYPQAVMSWCSCWTYTQLDHCTHWSIPDGLPDPHRGSSEPSLVLCWQLKDGQYMVWHEAKLLIWHKACCHKIIPFKVV